MIISSSDYKGSTVNNKDAMVPIGDKESGGRKIKKSGGHCLNNNHTQSHSTTHTNI